MQPHRVVYTQVKTIMLTTTKEKGNCIMKRTHTGWSAEEDALLLHEVNRAKRTHAPLQAAFDAVAKMTARRPNSVRNRYYTQLKEQSDPEPLFVPFTETESDELIRSVLLARAKGQSVRACTLELAGGDTRRMLRYQNKYRALLKSCPDRIARIRADLAASGLETPDPYTPDPNAPRVGRPPKSTVPTTAIKRLLDALYNDLLALSRGEVG